MIRITKRKAKSLFNKGVLVYFVPRKVCTQSYLCTSSSVKSGLSFEDTVGNNERYYCNRMTGLKLAFYIFN